jgi:cytochrome oxidase Cu insertion factor (SCO1/SenC/PrrC family)
MARKGKVSRQKRSAIKRSGLNRGRLVLGGSLVLILAIILVGLLASGSLTKKPGETTSTDLAAPDFQLTTFEGNPYALSQDKGKVRVVFFMIAPN